MMNMQKGIWLVVPGLLLASLAGCQLRCGGHGTSAALGFNPIAVQGQETWMIDGVSRKVEATYYLDLPEGFQFTAEVPVTVVPRSDAAAAEAAWPFLRYAFQHRLYSRIKIVSPRRGKEVIVKLIGIAFVQHIGPRARGKRVNMTLAEIDRRTRGGL